LSGEPLKATEDSYPQPLQRGSAAKAMYFRETGYDEIISPDYRKKEECSSDCFRKFDSRRKSC